MTVTHNVTFDDQVESTDNIVVEVVDGETVARPSEDPTLEDHTFGGWYTEPECLTEYEFATPVTSDITLYAKWVPSEEPTDPEEPGTDPEGPTDPEEPTDPDQPGDAAGQPGDDAPTAPSSDDAAKKAGSKGDELPQTGDATVAVSGIAALGAATVGLGAFLRRPARRFWAPRRSLPALLLMAGPLAEGDRWQTRRTGRLGRGRSSGA